MDHRAPTPLLLVMFIFLSCTFSTLAGGRSRPTIAPAAAPATAPPAEGPAATAPPAAHRSGGGGGPLDPRQLTALQSMGLPIARDPCSPAAAVGNATGAATACDSASPFRHLVALGLTDCPPDLDLPLTALRALSTLANLSFSHCPIPAPKRLPPTLAASLRSFSCVASLRRLSGVWLSRLANLTDLAVAGTPVVASGPAVVLSQMRRLRSATISAANLSGVLPHHWHCLNLTHLDLSANRLRGPVPSSIAVLGSLETLNLSSNALTGALPDSIGDLIYLKNATLSRNSLSGGIPTSVSALTELVHLDLSSNQFNGSVPRFLSELKKLRYLNLENNNFQGVIPFNASFIRRLEVFKVGSNSDLCYNHTLLSSKLKLGIAPCDKYGLPVSPPPDRSAKSDSSDDSGDDSDDDDSGGGKGGGGHHGPSKLVLGVAIGLSCLVFLVIFLVCLSKACG